MKCSQKYSQLLQRKKLTQLCRKPHSFITIDDSFYLTTKSNLPELIYYRYYHTLNSYTNSIDVQLMEKLMLKSWH